MAKRLCGCAVALLFIAGCASKAVPPSVPVAPRHPEFLYPVAPQGTSESQAAIIENGWRFLQADNLRLAERTFQDVLKRQPAFHPAETGLGYVELADRDPKSAIPHFDRALQAAADYVPALVGRGQAYLALDREGEALTSFEAALKADPSLTDLRARVDVLRFRGLQAHVSRAQKAAEAGRWDEARAAYADAIAASPESGFLYRDLASVERKAGDPAAALGHLRKALELDPSDARAHAQMGAMLEEQNDPVAALAAYERARALDPGEVPLEVLARVRDRAALARLPPEYGAIAASPNITRADLAALIAVRLAPLVAESRPRQVVVTDLRGNWAQEWILAVVRAGVMDTQPNYTFQPAARMRRADVAETVARVLGLIAARNPARAKSWLGQTPKISDVGPAHLNYPAVSQAVASGVMALEGGAFQLLRSVSGAEAMAIVGRLEALSKP